MRGQKYEPESEEVVLGRRKLHNEGPRVLYCSLSFIRIIKSSTRRIWVCSKHWRAEKYKKQPWLEIPEERNHVQGFWPRGEDNIKIYLKLTVLTI
jgi:hypothetical protein